jgi:SAM-dependent methyltransferase
MTNATPSKDPRRATAVLPAYGVESSIEAVVRDLAVAAYALRVRGIDLDVLMLDGGRHAELARPLAEELGLKIAVVRGPEAAPGPAYAIGMSEVALRGDADLVVTLDADGRHDPMQIPALIDQLVRNDADVVIGSRWTAGSRTPGLSLPRWGLSRLANLAFRFVTSTRGIADATTSFRVARADVVRQLGVQSRGGRTYAVHTTFVATAIASGYRVGEAPIIYRSSLAGPREPTLEDVREFASHLLELRAVVRDVRRRRLSPAGRVFRVEQFQAEDDVESLAGSKRFFDWVLEEFSPYLHGRILEVGAGTGNITRKLVDRYPDVSIVALEPAENMFAALAAFASLTPRVGARRSTLADYAHEAQEGFDAVLYLNVLEHIADDAEELRLAAKVLRPGGTLLLFGPAGEILYSELDHKAGHYRRYTTDQLRQIVTGAGLAVTSVRYFDILGFLPYLVAYRWLHRTAIPGSTVWSYDRLIVPASRALERLLPDPPLGKNVILIATKP